MVSLPNNFCHHAQHNKSYSDPSSWIFIIYDRTFFFCVLFFFNFIFGVSVLSSLAFLMHNKFPFGAVHPFCVGLKRFERWVWSWGNIDFIQRKNWRKRFSLFAFSLSATEICCWKIIHNVHNGLQHYEKSFECLLIKFISSICCCLIQLGNSSTLHEIAWELSRLKANTTLSLFQYSWDFCFVPF